MITPRPLLFPESEVSIELPQPHYETQFGAAFLGNSMNLLDTLKSNSVNLALTSPPFALTRKKEYGNEDEERYIEWFLPFATKLKEKLTEDGSFVLDLGGAYLPGVPVRSIYQFELLVKLCRELGFHLAQEFYHYNPARLPAPAEWVNVRRCRVKDSVNVVWWLSKTPWPKANNKHVLKPYSDSMRSLIKNGYKAKLRPSGHDIGKGFGKDNGGAVPANLIGYEVENILPISNTESNSYYMRRCKEENVKAHPARFPLFFAEFFIRFLTDPGDTVLDIFAGSNTTGRAAESLERKWLAFELSEEYLRTSMFRFEDPGQVDYEYAKPLGGLFVEEQRNQEWR